MAVVLRESALTYILRPGRKVQPLAEDSLSGIGTRLLENRRNEAATFGIGKVRPHPARAPGPRSRRAPARLRSLTAA